MVLNVNSAIQFNRNRDYDTRSIAIIQSRVGASRTNGEFDSDTVSSIHFWQGSKHRISSLYPDGKMGKNSLGVMIAELRRAGKNTDAAVLSQYPHNLPSGLKDPDGSPVKSFVRTAVTPLKLRRRPRGAQGWMMKGCFEINIEFDSGIVDPARYEYRQLIRGSASTTEGVFTNSAETIWTPVAAEASANHTFLVPGKLTNSFKEDGHKNGGITKKIGYRSAAPVFAPVGVDGIIDRYLPDQNGHKYQCRDTFGLEYKDIALIGTRVKIQLHYTGYIMDKLLVKIVDQKSWNYKNEAILRSGDV